ncbi:hypothetical protein [Flavobacterium sp. U410]
MSLNINSNSSLDSFEEDICTKLNDIISKIKGDSNRDWTIAVFEILSKIKQKDNKIACSKLDENLKDCGEWLFDYVEYTENQIILKDIEYSVLSDIHLIAEIEWSFYTQKNYFIDLKYDFEKLLVGKSNYRLFIFEHSDFSFIKNSIESLKKIASKFNKFETSERILFAAWHKGNNFYFDNYVK